MTLIKQLLREKLTERYLNENFFEKKETPLDDIIECIKNLLVNLRHSIGHEYKLKFFKNELEKALNDYKNSTKKGKNVLDILSKLEDEFDYHLIKELGIKKILLKIHNGTDKEKIIDSYIEDLGDNINNVFEKFKDKLKDDKTYDPIKEMNDGTKSTTINKFYKEKYFLQIELNKLMENVIKDNKKLLIIFEGRDAAGKGSSIQTFTEFLDPKHFKIETFGIASKEETKSENWFKRYEKVLPKEGSISIWDRSYYNRGLFELPMGWCTKKQYDDFMDNVNDFEENLVNKKGIILIKIFLDVNRTGQKLRFALRKHNPLSYFKFSETDSKMTKKWDIITPYIDKVLNNCDKIKWSIIDANDKYKAILSSMRTVLSLIPYEGKDVDVLYKKYEDVIFLDLHGVIIDKWYRKVDGELDCNKGYSKTAINNLNKITDVTDAKIIVISDCKKEMNFTELQDNLNKAGVTGEIKGVTDNRFKKTERIEQINDYLANHKVNNFIVLDDKSFNYKDDKEIDSRFIQPKHHVGLTDEETEKAIKILKNKEE